ncbi:putative PWWP domain-containing protein [Helianthus annuus]|nr:putative PWWP domain-containing protein [Helianthus annuus]
MGSFSEANGYNIDSAVGGLVWIRRRNGSWWPGRILSPNELPESCLLSPRRSGVPVQLLGKEDASVEWYNLEKSKRVKPFRCGEYDESIEKAKATATISCKKAAKYSHREDAILQALELENSQLSKSNNHESTSQTENNENLSDKSSDSEDDGTEGSTKRMRGLEDLGLVTAISSFKKKRSRVVCHQLTNVLKKTEMVTVPVTCEELTGLNGPSFSDNKMSHSTGNVVNSDRDANDCKRKENENSSNSDLLDNDRSSGRLFDVPFIREEKHSAGSSPGFVPETGRVGAGPVGTVSVEPDEFQESRSISSGVEINHIMDNGTSNWQNKGKRNSRNKNKTKTMQKILDPDDELRKVNMVDLMASQRSVPIRQPRSKKTDTGILYDVNVEVKAGHGSQHLPYVSLMSNFTGQTVTGHSLEVEVLNDTVSDLSLNNSCECLSSSCELGGVNKVNVVNEDVNMVSRLSRKPRKKGLLSNKKIRRLSSLTSSKKPSETRMLKRPDLACVPLKVVFGRIYSALGISSADAAPDP